MYTLPVADERNMDVVEQDIIDDENDIVHEESDIYTEEYNPGLI